MPKVLQLHLSWADTDEQALANAMTEWPNGGMKFPKADIRSPARLRRDGQAGARRRTSRAGWSSRPTRTCTGPRSSSSSTSASTGSTCTTSAATSASGSRCSAATCCPSSSASHVRGRSAALLVDGSRTASVRVRGWLAICRSWTASWLAAAHCPAAKRWWSRAHNARRCGAAYQVPVTCWSSARREVEPWHLAAHLDDEARLDRSAAAAPHARALAPPAGAAPHLAVGLRRLEQVGRGETVLIVAPEVAPDRLLERGSSGPSRSARRCCPSTAAIPSSDDLVHERMTVRRPAGWWLPEGPAAGPPPLGTSCRRARPVPGGTLAGDDLAARRWSAGLALPASLRPGSALRQRGRRLAAGARSPLLARAARRAARRDLRAAPELARRLGRPGWGLGRRPRRCGLVDAGGWLQALVLRPWCCRRRCSGVVVIAATWMYRRRQLAWRRRQQAGAPRILPSASSRSGSGCAHQQALLQRLLGLGPGRVGTEQVLGLALVVELLDRSGGGVVEEGHHAVIVHHLGGCAHLALKSGGPPTDNLCVSDADAGTPVTPPVTPARDVSLDRTLSILRSSQRISLELMRHHDLAGTLQSITDGALGLGFGAAALRTWSATTTAWSRWWPPPVRTPCARRSSACSHRCRSGTTCSTSASAGARCTTSRTSSGTCRWTAGAWTSTTRPPGRCPLSPSTARPRPGSTATRCSRPCTTRTAGWSACSASTSRSTAGAPDGCSGRSLSCSPRRPGWPSRAPGRTSGPRWPSRGPTGRPACSARPSTPPRTAWACSAPDRAPRASSCAPTRRCSPCSASPPTASSARRWPTTCTPTSAWTPPAVPPVGTISTVASGAT